MQFNVNEQPTRHAKRIDTNRHLPKLLGEIRNVRTLDYSACYVKAATKFILRWNKTRLAHELDILNAPYLI
jgi:hypothetical protein